MSDFRIEKIRRHLDVILTDGSRLEGEVFVRPVSRYRSRPEEPIDLLNDAEPFFALVHDGQAVLVAKTNVSRAETPVPEEQEFEVAQLGVLVEVMQTDGTVCTGSVFLE